MKTLFFFNKTNASNKVLLNSHYNIIIKKHLIKSVVNLKLFIMLYKVERIIEIFIGIIIIAYFKALSIFSNLSFVKFNCYSAYYQKKLFMLPPLLKKYISYDTSYY